MGTGNPVEDEDEDTGMTVYPRGHGESEDGI